MRFIETGTGWYLSASLMAPGMIVSLGLPEWMTIHFVGGVVILLVLLLVLVALRLSLGQKDRVEVSNRTSDYRPDPGEIAELTPPERGGQPPERQAEAGNKTPAEPSRPAPPKVPVLSAEELEALEATEPLQAAWHWGRLGNWSRAGRAFEKAGESLRAALVWIGLRQHRQALSLLRECFKKSPAEECVRLLLIESLLKEGETREAEDLTLPTMDPEFPAKPSADFLEAAGRAWEAVDNLPIAQQCYNAALHTGKGIPELSQRLLFLRELSRLSGPLEEVSPARHFLDEALRDSSTRPKTRETPEETPGRAPEPLTGHEIVVGHLAFGFSRDEPEFPPRSIFSLSRRYLIERLLSTTPYSATFEARDRVLDFTVALKLYRLPTDFRDFDTLKERLRTVAQLNHPNLAKLTFVDRNGPMLRLATEFLPGGNLIEFLNKLGGVGIPLLTRMAIHLASALHTAHLRGVPHGNLRPENILIGPDQRAKLIDFALSPIPVEHLADEFPSSTESSDNRRILEAMHDNEGVQGDLVQFGDVLDYMMHHARRTVDPIASNGPDPAEQLAELVRRLRDGEFNSVLRLLQVLEEIFHQALPSQGDTESKRLGI